MFLYIFVKYKKKILQLCKQVLKQIYKLNLTFTKLQKIKIVNGYFMRNIDKKIVNNFT